jgi:16S rRNA (guanine1207-N2)-methyltransferase
VNDAVFETPFGNFTLQRRPQVKRLRAWDAADEYLIELAADHPAQRALVVNDGFGALACALHRSRPVSWGDSFTSHLCTRENYQRNGLEADFSALPATAAPQGPFDLVLWRVPKSLALFEQQIARLHGVLTAQTTVIAGGMDKHLLPDTKALLSRLGQVDTLPGRKKSHLFRLAPDPSLPPPPQPRHVELPLPEHDLILHGDANVFARERLDIGARFFIDQFAALPPARRVADLGCGNGVLSLVLARARPDSEVYLFDDSYQAIASAMADWRGNIGEPAAERFHVDDVFCSYRGEPFDLILCNPPFHQQHVVGDHIARRMFAQGRRHLRTGGELWVVANRHLDYPRLLRQLFGNCRRLADGAKFMVLAATAERSG